MGIYKDTDELKKMFEAEQVFKAADEKELASRKAGLAKVNMPEDVFAKFEDLVSALSPENLSCDGELPKSQIQARYKQLTAQWKQLEKQLGRTITEDEIWDAIIARSR